VRSYTNQELYTSTIATTASTDALVRACTLQRVYKYVMHERKLQNTNRPMRNGAEVKSVCATRVWTVR
jgi:hypothetical protein